MKTNNLQAWLHERVALDDLKDAVAEEAARIAGKNSAVSQFTGISVTRWETGRLQVFTTFDRVYGNETLESATVKIVDRLRLMRFKT